MTRTNRLYYHVYYHVYYMDNDRQKQVIRRNLSYMAAVEFCQKKYSEGFSCTYEVQ